MDITQYLSPAAIISVFKAGFLITLRGGMGLVVAQLSKGEWSAPSAIALGGLGGGFEIGIELSDFVIVLNSKRALLSFSKGGNVTLGGNLSVCAGPLGKSYEADVAARSIAAFYIYTKTVGLFAGVSIEGSALVERKGANAKLYKDNVRARELLGGFVPPPNEAAPLYSALDADLTSSRSKCVICRFVNVIF